MGGKTHELLVDGRHYAWLVWCPACDEPHTFDDRWPMTGTADAPTFDGSMLAHESPVTPRCHSTLTAGVWHYAGDCTHDKVGQALPAPDWATTRFGRMRPDGVVPVPLHAADCAKAVADRAWLEAEFDGQHPEIVDVACTCGAGP
jgi:hypothetical protein